MLSEAELQSFSHSRLRYEEAKHFLGEYIRYCGPPVDSYFGMIACCDSFLFCFVSIEEMGNSKQKTALNNRPVFKFLKACRDVTTHHSILVAPDQPQKFNGQRPFSRHVVEGGDGSSARLKVTIDQFRTIFARVKRDWQSSAPNLNAAEVYLKSLEAAGRTDVFIEDVFQEGMDAVANELGF